MATALVVETAAASALKLLTHRGRPVRRGRPSDSRSMPSGHTANLAATAMALAALTALSRVVVNRYWASDGAIGLLLGYAAGKVADAAIRPHSRLT